MATTGTTTTTAYLMECLRQSATLYQNVCSEENLFIAYQKARKGKSSRRDVKEFEKELESNLSQLRMELLLHSYQPKPLKTFIIRDPKTRTIRKSDFRDRIVHHAICNILMPIFDKTFIADSFANRVGKGSLNAIERFDSFKRKVSKNDTRTCFVFKADIRHYFEDVNHEILIKIINKKIKDKELIWLILKVLRNHAAEKGMPLGNMTSQFFANIYLNELDQFVKHNLKAKHYIRYVDDFVILHNDKKVLEEYQEKINCFIKRNLALDLHPTKCKIVQLHKGITFLGFRIFNYHRLLRRTNIRTMRRRLKEYDYDKSVE
ncbi:MAG TPA: reverse transcriptase domain-containing protein, partial [Candidatus Nanoarchaeia archaeon]|nr:reverse transcriptase domain-containing protein [Candidatus Nanoarchaeia archaeon]